jgi:hypothetical protein
MQQYYTMASERQAQAKQTGAAGKNDLGNNVELF